MSTTESTFMTTFFLQHSLARQVTSWAAAQNPSMPDEYACATRDVFRARADSLIIRLRRAGMPEERAILADAVLSEIGNNAFDHNIGNWRDIPGVFFGADISEKPLFVIADRGQGIRTTLARVRPDFTTDAQALKAAFTERISGRAPERRGNGLKFVRHVLLSDGLDLWFCSGTANYQVIAKKETWSEVEQSFPGCCAILSSS